MKSLMMLRHAEAAAMAAPRADRQRVLTARGQTQAQRLGMATGGRLGGGRNFLLARAAGAANRPDPGC